MAFGRVSHINYIVRFEDYFVSSLNVYERRQGLKYETTLELRPHGSWNSSFANLTLLQD